MITQERQHLAVLLQWFEWPGDKARAFFIHSVVRLLVRAPVVGTITPEIEVEMLQVGEVDVKGLTRFENMLGALGAEAPKAVNRAINRTGDMARTQVVRALSKQTGLPQKTIRRAVKVKRSSWDNLEYNLTSAGGDVSLKYFKKRETREGVVADLGMSRGKVLFEGSTFFRGGAFPARRVKISSMGGHVFVRDGGRTNLSKIKSGVFIPVEMVEGASADAFERVVADVLPRRLDHEIGRALSV